MLSKDLKKIDDILEDVMMKDDDTSLSKKFEKHLDNQMRSRIQAMKKHKQSKIRTFVIAMIKAPFKPAHVALFLLGFFALSTVAYAAGEKIIEVFIEKEMHSLSFEFTEGNVDCDGREIGIVIVDYSQAKIPFSLKVPEGEYQMIITGNDILGNQMDITVLDDLKMQFTCFRDSNDVTINDGQDEWVIEGEKIDIEDGKVEIPSSPVVVEPEEPSAIPVSTDDNAPIIPLPDEVPIGKVLSVELDRDEYLPQAIVNAVITLELDQEIREFSAGICDSEGYCSTANATRIDSGEVVGQQSWRIELSTLAGDMSLGEGKVYGFRYKAMDWTWGNFGGITEVPFVVVGQQEIQPFELEVPHFETLSLAFLEVPKGTYQIINFSVDEGDYEVRRVDFILIDQYANQYEGPSLDIVPGVEYSANFFIDDTFDLGEYHISEAYFITSTGSYAHIEENILMPYTVIDYVQMNTDVIPPHFVSVSIDKESMRIDEKFIITFEGYDGETALEDVTFSVINIDNEDFFSPGADLFSLNQGLISHGEFSVPSVGTWEIRQVRMKDIAGNEVYLGKDEIGKVQIVVTP